MCTYIRHRALRVGCDRTPNSAFRPLLSNFLHMLILGPPLIQTDQPRPNETPPLGWLRKPLFLSHVHFNIHCFTFRNHRFVNNNFKFCIISLLIFTFSLSCKSTISCNSFRIITKRENRNHQIPMCCCMISFTLGP